MLGRGSFGTVYLKDCFAVKRSKAEDFESLQAIVRELFVLRLNLKGCIKYHHVKSTGSIFYIYMDLADGNLRQIQPPKDFEKQLLEAVYELHRHDIVHRDLKPANILVRKDQIFLCDFGLSRSLETDFSNGTGYIVSRWYRSPEIHYNPYKNIVYTKAMDCWSVGCILYEMENNEPLNSNMKFDFDKKIKKELHKNLLMFDAEKRWSMGQCLGKTELKRERVNRNIKLNDVSLKWFLKFPDKRIIFELAQELSDKNKKYDDCLMLSILALDSPAFYYLINEELDINLNMVYHFIKDKLIFQSITKMLCK